MYMKKVILLSLIFAFAASSHAQTMDKKWGFGVGAGAYGSITDQGNGFMPELYLSRYLNPRLDVLFQNDVGLYNSSLNNSLDLGNSFINLRYKFTDENKALRPYLFAGPGFLANNQVRNFNYDVGLGTKYYLNSTTALYLEAGYSSGVEAITHGITGRESIWKAIVGIELDFGKTKDSDLDGVSDKKDICPNTPAGVSVDMNGCPVDTDGDGVADYLDNCPADKGLTSLKGCPDADNDGIADKDDACPDVAGLAKLKGCPDSDGDGVTDNDDRCADTKKGYKVDAYGCPFDTDKDGVIDEEDDCPTVFGPSDSKGCPVKVVEKKIEELQELTIEQVEIQNIKVASVHFVSNKSYLTDYSKAIMDKLVKIMNNNPDFRVNIFGFADSRGEEGHNIVLSQDRVKTASDYLTSKGISKDRMIQQKAFGEAKPIASNATEEGRLKNRRVEFELFKMK